MMILNDIRIRDPFVLLENGIYYMYSSGCGGFDGECSTFLVYQSADLEHWSEPKMIFNASVEFWSHLDYWAPEVHKYENKYYLFASLKSETACRGTQIFVSDTPDGTFVPLTDEPVTPRNWECLDGTLYIDKSGAPYIVFCHEWLQVYDGEICAMRLSDDLSKAVGDPFLLFRASELALACPCNGADGYVTDGPFLFRTKTGTLLLLWSTLCNEGYCEAIAYSDNGEIDGKWCQAPELLFKKDGGHGMVFMDKEGKLRFVMHYPNKKDERALFCELDDYGDTILIKNINT